MSFKFLNVLSSSLSGCISTDSLKHGRKACFSALYVTGKHRSAAYENCRNIYSCRSHKESGNILVAVGNHNKSVKMVGKSHTLSGIGNKVTGYKGVLHALVSHSNTVTDSYCRENNGSTAAHSNTKLYSLNYLVDIHMTGNDFVI